MQTSQKSIFDIIEETSTSSAGASPASPTARQAKDWGKMTSDISGPKCLEQFEKFNHVGSWAKMFSALLIGMEGWSSTKCRLNWKLRGTKSNRLYFQLQASALPTEGTEFGFAPTEMLPTPTTDSATNRKDKYKQGGTPLSVAVNKMLPTPCAQKGGKITGKENQDSLTKRAREQTGKTSQLNPPFVAEMMGFPTDWTASPFLSGETNA